MDTNNRLLTTPDHHISFFTSSQFEQHPDLTEYLKKILSENPFNKYCIDCKKNKTTHFLVWLGSFVCESCSIEHLNLPYGSQSRTMVKNILNDHWDDYQLRSIAIGGNKPLFEILKEYEI